MYIKSKMQVWPPLQAAARWVHCMHMHYRWLPAVHTLRRLRVRSQRGFILWYPGRSGLSFPPKGLPVGPCFGPVRILAGWLRTVHSAEFAYPRHNLQILLHRKRVLSLKIRQTGLRQHRARVLSFCRTNLPRPLWRVTC